MAFSQENYEKLAAALGVMDGLSEKRMFGGLCFMLHGNMLCGVHKGGGMFRVGKDNHEQALALPGVSPMEMTGRKMGGFVEFEEYLFDDPDVMSELINLGLNFVGALPPK
ncbi:MAG: TfoX/Sxy family protein [Pikeienuella sp.]